MTNPPKSFMLLAGLLASRSLTLIIVKATEEHEYLISGGWIDSEICRLNGVPWALLIVLSAGVAILTTVKSKEGRLFQGIITFFASLLLNVADNMLGFITFYCSRNNVYNQRDAFTYLDEMAKIHAYFSLSVVGLACLGIMAHYLIKSTPQATILPDPEVILLGLGVCVQVVVWDSIYLAHRAGRESYAAFCKTGGLASWLQLLVLSVLLAIFTLFKTKESFRIPRSLFTLVGSFLLHLIQYGTGKYAIECATPDGYFSVSKNKDYEYAALVLNAILALALTLLFLFDTQNTEMPEQRQNDTVIVSPNAHSTSYPLQPSYPAFNVNQSQATYPPQAPYPAQATYPPQAPYPAQPPQCPPQGSHPPPAYYSVTQQKDAPH